MASSTADLDLKREQLERLQAALVAAFPDRFAFSQFTRYKLDLELDRIVGDVGIDQVAFELIGWAKAQGRLGQIVACARAENPGNPELREFADRMGIAASAMLGEASPAGANRGLAALQ